MNRRKFLRTLAQSAAVAPLAIVSIGNKPPVAPVSVNAENCLIQDATFSDDITIDGHQNTFIRCKFEKGITLTGSHNTIWGA